MPNEGGQDFKACSGTLSVTPREISASTLRPILSLQLSLAREASNLLPLPFSFSKERDVAVTSNFNSSIFFPA